MFANIIRAGARTGGEVAKQVTRGVSSKPSSSNKIEAPFIPESEFGQLPQGAATVVLALTAAGIAYASREESKSNETGAKTEVVAAKAEGTIARRELSK